LTKPLKALTVAAQSITEGQLEQRVPVNSNDEIGQLSTAFNRMSQEVSRVNLLRKQMTADIAHDLRTPLTVISGYIESMQDGILKPTPERLTIIYTEIELLQKLVDDLRMLSLADAGELSLNPQRISPGSFLERASALFMHQAEQHDISLEVNKESNPPDIWVDDARMIQVIGNLISNSLRYTPAGGRITLSTRAVGDKVDISVQDTGEGIDADELPNIFARFHRSDKSRHSETGETGLGLAIVKALVEAQGGSVSADSIPGEGTTIHILFPVMN
jgi:signal transduction histidine kinase